MESSLTAPEDRDTQNKWRPDQSTPVLTKEQTEEAMKALNDTSFVDKFPKVDRAYADPRVDLQVYGLISFIPAKGATPNENGIYGFAKLRGNYETQLEADHRAEFLIRNVDSYHKIYHAYVGRPFPLTNESKFSADTKEIDIKKEIAQSVSKSVKDSRDEEQRVIAEIKSKEEALLAESERAKQDDGTGDPYVDPYDLYITLCVKKAQLSWTYLEHTKKMAEVKDIILKTRRELEELDRDHPDFRDKYFDKYMEARRASGLQESPADSQSNFIKYMVEDAKLPGIDE